MGSRGRRSIVFSAVFSRPKTLAILVISILLALLLHARYEEIAGAVSEQLAWGVAFEDLMGGSTDALKLVSSLTLFRAAAQSLCGEDPPFASLAQCCDSILEQTRAQGYAPCAHTVAQVTG